MSEKNELYPIFLKLDQLKLLLVGAGNVGLEKLQSLLSNSPNADISIVAPEIREEIIKLCEHHINCKLIKRRFEEADLENKHFVILATDKKELHKEIKRIATERRIIVNTADTPSLCDFYLASIVRKGNLKIAISTNGKSPTAAKRIRETLENTIPEEIDELLINLHRVRNKLSGDFAQKVKELNELTRTLVEKI